MACRSSCRSQLLLASGGSTQVCRIPVPLPSARAKRRALETCGAHPRRQLLKELVILHAPRAFWNLQEMPCDSRARSCWRASLARCVAPRRPLGCVGCARSCRACARSRRVPVAEQDLHEGLAFAWHLGALGFPVQTEDLDVRTARCRLRGAEDDDSSCRSLPESAVRASAVLAIDSESRKQLLLDLVALLVVDPVLPFQLADGDREHLPGTLLGISRRGACPAASTYVL